MAEQPLNRSGRSNESELQRQLASYRLEPRNQSGRSEALTELLGTICLMLSEGRGVYSNREILTAIEQDHIVIEPFNREHLAGSSYDVTLGDWFYRTEILPESGIYNPLSKTDVDRYFGQPLQAETHDEWRRRNRREPFDNIPLDSKIIVLAPHERILAHTNEFIGIRPPGTSTMQARSTYGRNGIVVCQDAGWGDPGYINRWTMEIQNMNRHVSVPLVVGERVAQIVFHRTGPVDSQYTALSGKYQSSAHDNLEQIMATWQPGDMLPKAYKDRQ